MSSRSCEDEATVIPGEQPCICPPPCISTLTQYSPCPRCRHPHKSRGSIPSNEDADRKPAVLFGTHPGNRRCAGSIQGSRTKSCWSSSIKSHLLFLLCQHEDVSEQPTNPRHPRSSLPLSTHCRFHILFID